MEKMTKLERALEQAYWKANKIGEAVDIIEVISGYKALSDATDDEVEAMYCYIADRMGLSNEEQLTPDLYNILARKGYFGKKTQEEALAGIDYTAAEPTEPWNSNKGGKTWGAFLEAKGFCSGNPITGNRPCDNGAICDKCAPDWVQKEYERWKGAE